jgi:hypothetical protein
VTAGEIVGLLSEMPGVVVETASEATGALRWRGAKVSSSMTPTAILPAAQVLLTRLKGVGARVAGPVRLQAKWCLCSLDSLSVNLTACPYLSRRKAAALAPQAGYRPHATLALLASARTRSAG